MTVPPRLRTLAAALVLSLLPAVSGLAQPDAPLDVRVAVENQQADAREAGLRQALERVLIRLSGRDDVAAQPALSEVFAQPGRFVQRYRYESGDQGLLLAVRFDASGLRQALTAAQVPVWTAGRTPMLLWLAVERGGERLLVGSDETPVLRAELESAARRRGVELMFPLLDAEDRRRVGFTDVFGGFTERVRLASARYGTPLVLMGRVHREAGDWVARWSLASERGEAVWESAGAALEAALDRGVGELASRLVSEQTAAPIAGSPGADLLLRVSGVASVEDYARMQRSLRGIAGVRDLRPLLLEQDSVVLQLDLEVDAPRLLRTLERGPTFKRDSLLPATATAAATVEHNFRLQP